MRIGAGFEFSVVTFTLGTTNDTIEIPGAKVTLPSYFGNGLQ